VAFETKLPRREASNDEIVLGMLGAVERDPALTQRSVASELGIALGLANTYLKRCVRKGLIKVSQAPARRYTYYLTPQGFAEKSRLTASYLAHSFSFFRRARQQCSELFAAASSRGHCRIALIGKSDLAEIAGLVARENPEIDIVGTIAASEDWKRLAASVKALAPPADAVLIAALEKPSEVYAAACKVMGADRVYAPTLLRIRTVEEQSKSNREKRR
jgi:DNA-binding MarR family transcriptional regulator